MNKFKVYVLVSFFAVSALPLLAEPNSTEPEQLAIITPSPTITAAPEPLIPPQAQSQPQSTMTEQIIERAHNYYNSALNHALTVIGIAVSILVVGIVLIQIFFEFQRSRSFKEQLDKKEEQLQKYFDKRFEEEVEKIKEDAQKQMNSVICKVKLDLFRVYTTISVISLELYEMSKDSRLLGLCGGVRLLMSSTVIDLGRYDDVASGFDDVKEFLNEITEPFDLELIRISIEHISKQINEIEDNKLKKAFNEVYEAFILKKHELGYTTPSEDKQEIANLLKFCARTSEPTPKEDMKIEYPQAIAESAERQGADILTTDDVAVIKKAITKNLGKELKDFKEEDYETVNELSIHGKKITDITLLKQCKELIKLHLNTTNISDISPLAGLTKLTTLWLGNNQISDISALNELANLTHLWLYDNQISDISPLKKLMGLRLLSLYGNQISKISPLEKLTNLTTLALGSNEIIDISPLDKLTNLTTLSLVDNQINNISAIVKMTKLCKFSLQGNPISNISPISNFRSLEELYLSKTGIIDITPLKNLTELILLDLNNTEVNDLTPIKGLKKLTHLYVSTTQLDKIKTVSELTNLRLLGITSTNVSDLSPIKQLNHLDALFLSGTPVNTLEPLKDLKKLRILSFQNTKIDTLESLKDLTGLQTLKIQNTPINSLEPLKGLGNLKSLYIEDCKNITDKQVDVLKKALPQLKIFT